MAERRPASSRRAVLRAALHGWVTLETTFVHPADIDRSFDRLV